MEEIEVISLDEREPRKKSKADKEAMRIMDLFQKSSGGQRSLWLTREQLSYDYFLNNQLTEDEYDLLTSAGMPTFIINRITPIIETMKFFITANNPRWKAVGVDGTDSNIARIHTDIIDYCWYISSGRAILAQAVQDALVKSKGYIHIYVDPNADQGMGEVMFERVDPFHVFVASMSSDILERDAAYHIIKKDIPRKDLLDMLPQYKRKIKAATGWNNPVPYDTQRDTDESDSTQPGDMEDQYDPETTEIDDILDYFEAYEPMRIKYYNVFQRVEASEKEIRNAEAQIENQLKEMEMELTVRLLEQQKEMQAAVANGEMLKERYDLEMIKAEKQMQIDIEEHRNVLINKVHDESSEIQQNVMPEVEYNIIKEEIADTLIKAIPYYERKVKKTCVVGDKHLYTNILNTCYTPLIPIPYLHTGTTCPMSAVTPLQGKQEEINKAHQIMIHNANLSSNMRWKMVEGEVDADKWASNAAAPGGMLFYRPGFSAEGPKEVMPQNINNAFFTVEQDAKSDMEYIAGIQPPSMGMSGEREETYRGFLAKDEYGTRRIKSWIANVFEPALEHVGKVFMEMSKDLYDVHKVFRVVQPLDAGGYEERNVEINIPIYDDFANEIGRFNDYKTSRYDIRIVAGSTLPINRWAVLEEYKELMQFGVVDDIAVLAQTDLPNKEQIAQRKSMLSQFKQQNDQLLDLVKQKDGTIETLSRQIIQAGIREEILKSTREVERSKTETKAADKLMRERMSDNVKMAAKDISKTLQDVKKSEKSEK